MIVSCVGSLLNISFSGIGGFMVRQRSRPGQGPGKAKRSLSRKDSSGSVSEPPTGKEEGEFPHIDRCVINCFCLNILFLPGESKLSSKIPEHAYADLKGSGSDL